MIIRKIVFAGIVIVALGIMGRVYGESVTVTNGLKDAVVTFVVAASNSTDKSKAKYICDGFGDQEEINAAIAALPPEGGTVLLLEGTYDIRRIKPRKYKMAYTSHYLRSHKVESSYFETEMSVGGIVIDRSDVCLQGAGKETKLILAADQTVNVVRVVGDNIGNIVIRGLYIDGNKKNNPVDKKPARFEANGIKVGLLGEDKPPAGYKGNFGSAHDVTIDSCHVVHTHCLGIMPYGKNMMVTNNYLQDASSDCIEVLGGPATVVNNVVVNQQGDFSHVGIGTDVANDVIIRNNQVICDGGGFNLGIRIWAGTARTTIENNQVICKSGRIDKGWDIRGDLTTITGNTVSCIGGTIGEIEITGHSSAISDNKFENCGEIRIQSVQPAMGPIILKDNQLQNTFVNAVTDNVKYEKSNIVKITPLAGREATIRQTAVPPVIDGKLNDACWKEAVMLKDFVNAGYNGGKIDDDLVKKDETTACLAYDSKNLYVAFKCFESRITNLCANMKKHDGNIESGDDAVGVFLDTDFNRQNYYYVFVNSLGICEEKKAAYGIREEWNPQIQVKTSVEDKFWVVEMAIPFSELGASPAKGKTWGLNLVRNHRAGIIDPQSHYYGLWNYPDHRDPHIPHRFGTILFE